MVLNSSIYTLIKRLPLLDSHVQLRAWLPGGVHYVLCQSIHHWRHNHEHEIDYHRGHQGHERIDIDLHVEKQFFLQCVNSDSTRQGKQHQYSSKELLCTHLECDSASLYLLPTLSCPARLYAHPRTFKDSHFFRILCTFWLYAHLCFNGDVFAR